jgi:hypothetical protein
MLSFYLERLLAKSRNRRNRLSSNHSWTSRGKLQMNEGASSSMVGLALMLSMLLTPAVTDAQQLAIVKGTFLVIYRPGPAWLPGKPITEQPLKEHGKYMLSLYISGRMKLAGPLTDNAGGAVLLDVADESEASDRCGRPGCKVWNLCIRTAPVGIEAVGRVLEEAP